MSRKKGEGGGRPGGRRGMRLKVVVRCLPPHLPADVFWASVAPWVRCASNALVSDPAPHTPEAGAQPTADYAEYIPGKRRTRTSDAEKPSLAYIRFVGQPQMLAFARAFQGHIFRDAKGAESAARIEMAPVQVVAGQRRPQRDPLVGTVESTPEWAAFIASLQATPSAEARSAPREEPPESTPLLDYLRERRIKAQTAHESTKKQAKEPTDLPASDAKAKKGKGSRADDGERPKPKGKEAESAPKPVTILKPCLLYTSPSPRDRG